jgi:serine/threonine-protein kinase
MLSTSEYATLQSETLPRDHGKLQLIELIGSSAIWRSYRAIDPLLDRQLHVRLIVDAQATSSALQTARKLAGLIHPNIATINAIEQEGNALAIASEWLDGRRLDTPGAISAERCADVLVQAAHGLDAAARHGVVHGDVTPRRLFEVVGGTIKIEGFGLARPLASDGLPVEEGYEADGEPIAPVWGSPETIAPECIQGQPATVQSDIYALGATLYQLISGRPPFQGRRIADQLLAKLTRAPTPLQRVVPRCDTALAQVIDRMVAPRAQDRFADYRQLLGAIEPLLPGHRKVASLPARIQATVLDILLFPLVLGLLAVMSSTAETALALVVNVGPLFIIVRHALAWAACLACFVLMVERYGQTPGKMVFRLRLLDARARRPTRQQIMLRFLLSQAVVLALIEQVWLGTWQSTLGWPLCLVLGGYLLIDLGCAVVGGERRTLHDRLLGSWLVVAQELPRKLFDDYVPPDPLAHTQLEAARRNGERLSDGTLMLDKIGAGGMGEVRRGYDERLQRAVAIKMLAAERRQEAGFDERFQREARLLASLSHPNVVKVFGFGEEAGRCYYTMEMVEGRSLAQELAINGPLEAYRAVELMRQAAAGLATAAEQGVIHRDVKPSNMILASDGRLKLVDFGLAKQQGAAGEAVSGRTSTGVILGTPHYMAPEVGRGEPADLRSDIYSLGASFYHLITGQLPFTARTPMGVVVQHIGEPLPLRPLKQAAPPALVEVIQRMLAKQPERRYASYQELDHALLATRPAALQRAGIWSHGAALTADLVMLLVAWATGLGLAILLAAREYDSGLNTSSDPHWAEEVQHHFQAGYYWVAIACGAIATVIAALFLLRGAATPGMRWVGLVLRQLDGTPPSLRQLLAMLAFVPAGYPLWIMAYLLASIIATPLALSLLGVLIAIPLLSFVSQRRWDKTIPELISGTVVCYRND